MEERRWEDMKRDCLVEVFQRVGLESLAFDVPFVCKSWYQASLQPQCWKTLDFSYIFGDDRFTQKYITRFDVQNFSGASFAKFVLRRGNKFVEDVALPHQWNSVILKVLVNECPTLKKLYSPTLYKLDDVNHFAQIVGSFTHLQFLHLNQFLPPMEKILEQVSLHCGSLVSFSTLGIVSSLDATAIVDFLPKIKFLSLRGCYIGAQSMRIVLKGCRELEFLDASDCIGFVVDDELLKLAAHVKLANFANSQINRWGRRFDVRKGYAS